MADPADQTGTQEQPNQVPNDKARTRNPREPETQDHQPGTTDTASDTGIAPKVRPYDQFSPANAEFEVNRLNAFLHQRFPNVAIMTPNGPEGPVDTAIRLLEGMATSGDTVRCPEAFCNKPRGHRDEHGWIVRQ